MKKVICLYIISSLLLKLSAQNTLNNPSGNHGNKFELLGSILPTPNDFRTASGSPGSKYWQQRADYEIACELDEKNQKLSGVETITYFNNSPQPLDYLWFQLDENQHSPTNNANYQVSNKAPNQLSLNDLNDLSNVNKNIGYGTNIKYIRSINGADFKYTINKTMMRVDLPKTLNAGETIKLKIAWSYKIPNRFVQGGRGGFEYFKKDDSYIFTISQWYPRLCVFSDFQGWQNHQFTGRAEFALTFGNFDVKMTVPANHIVCSTGEGQNFKAVLTPLQFQRYNNAKLSKEPLEIVTLEEARKAETFHDTKKKTWHFIAQNVRDFAWGSSPKFVWDGMPVKIGNKEVMCMSFYGKEAYTLYKKFSTKVVAHAIKTYSDFTIPYPYPVAQSVEASSGMEYPMISFNFGRTEEDGSYSEGTKNGMIGVIMHEVGHNFFPMIINSDERQWTWLDEGLNTFVEYLAEELWDNNFPSKKGAAYHIVDYMKLPKDQLEPIMTNAENIIMVGQNSYSKPAAALNILRETVMGRELFDFAFKQYAKKWAFKHPTPADLFRTMEDASGMDLSWFWRGWFYGTDPVDISLDSLKTYTPESISEEPKDQKITRKIDKPQKNALDDISKIRNRADSTISYITDRDTAIQDFYWKYNKGLVPYDTTSYEIIRSNNRTILNDEEKKKLENSYFYELYFSNVGGLVMPIIIQWNYEDGSSEIERIPAHVWRLNEKNITKFFAKGKKVKSVLLDPFKETADINEKNNTWGIIPEPSKFKVFKEKLNVPKNKNTNLNPMNFKKRV